MTNRISKVPFIKEYMHIIPRGSVRAYGEYDYVSIVDKEYVKNDMGKEYFDHIHVSEIFKMKMLDYVAEFLGKQGIQFDKFNGLPPTRINGYKAYEFSTLFLWSILCRIVDNKEAIDFIFNKSNFYKKFGKVIASVFNKYPKITGLLIGLVDMKVPDNKFLDCTKIEEVDFDNDHTDENDDDEKATDFKNWLMKWYDKATDHDKMRVRHWFDTGKSHKQILSEIRRVKGNYHKFNSRLSAFIERLLNHENLENFMSKSGYPNKEEMFMAYFETITDFDDDTKRKFIKKYLV